MTTLALLKNLYWLRDTNTKFLAQRRFMYKRDRRQRLRDKDRRQRTREKKREQERGVRGICPQRKTKDCHWIEGRQLCHRKMAVCEEKRETLS